MFSQSGDAEADLLWTWALTSIIAHSLAVLGTVIVTAFVKDVFATPLINTVFFGLFIGSMLATAKISYTHGLAQESTTTENVRTFTNSRALVSPLHATENANNADLIVLIADHVQPQPCLPGTRLWLNSRECGDGGVVQGRHLINRSETQPRTRPDASGHRQGDARGGSEMGRVKGGNGTQLHLSGSVIPR